VLKASCGGVITLEAGRAVIDGSTDEDLDARRYLAEAIESMSFVILQLRTAARREQVSA
jgi:hypothetical protein